MKRSSPLASVFLGLLGVGCGGGKEPVAPSPIEATSPAAASTPSTDRHGTRIGTSVDHYFGAAVADPYRWLEEGESEEVARWTAAENQRTAAYLEGISDRQALHQRIVQALSIGYASAPVATQAKQGRRYFFTRREGSENQPTLYVRDGDRDADRALIDVSKLSADGTSALDWWYPSWSGKLVVWGRSESGDEISTLHVRDVETGQDEAETIPWTRHASVAFLPDEQSFFYTRYPEPGSVPAGDEKYGSKVFLHRRGQDWRGDREVFSRPDKTEVPSVSISPDGRFVLVHVHAGWDKSDLWLWDRKVDEEPNFRALTAHVQGRARHSAWFSQGLLFIQSNDGAPNYRLFSVPPTKATERAAWSVVLEEQGEPLIDVAVTAKEITALYLRRAASRLERFDRSGRRSLGAIALPGSGLGTAKLSPSLDGREVFASVASFATPSGGYRVQLGQGAKLVPWVSVKGGGPSDIHVQQREAISKDGTKIPYFVVSKGELLEVSPEANRGAGSAGEQKREVSPEANRGTGSAGEQKREVSPEANRGAGSAGEQKREVSPEANRGAGSAGEQKRKLSPAKTVLYGYGGFNIAQTPSFSPRVLSWVESGGVWVSAVLRGGGEFGEQWHQAGMLERKQNVFDDFYAVAQAISGPEGFTDADHLAAMGGSNGGLLVAASVVQHPEAFRAAVSMVPLCDMLRYQHFRIAKLWIPEYGSSEDPKLFPSLRAYSPYHNVRDGVRYPATLFTTAESDSRVDPMHARKMAARLRAGQADDSRPILLRVEAKAGHGAGKPVSKIAEEMADQLGFLRHELGAK